MAYKDVRMRFLGSIEGKVDSKGRVFLPSAFRKALACGDGGGMVLRKDVFQDCLVIYPEAVWNEQMDSLRLRLNRWNKAHQQVFRQYVSEVEAVALDANGRILIPKRYLRLAAIDQSVKFIGMGDTIELWAAEKTDKPFMDPNEFGQVLEGLMDTDDSEK